jgi:hypothetical protein
MKNTNQTLAIILLMAVLFAGGLSIVSIQKAMAQGTSEEPKENADQKDNPDKDQNESSQPVTEPKENAPAK